MMNWLRRLFQARPQRIRRLPKRKIYLVETYKCCDEYTLKRQRIEDIPFGGGGIGYRKITHPAGTINLKQYRYWCSCGTELTDGPTGGDAVCAVCSKCKLNYGADLPGYWGH